MIKLSEHLKFYESVYRPPGSEEYTFKVPEANGEMPATVILTKMNDEIRFEVPIHSGGRKEIEKRDFKKYINNQKFVKLLNMIYEDNFYDIIAKLNKLTIP